MEFRNLTPFATMAFDAVDVAGVEFHVVVLKAAYVMERNASSEPDDDTHNCVLQEGDAAVPLSMADEYEGAVSNSSVRSESDLAPFKPKCDVIIRATSFAPNGVPARWWHAHARVMDGDALVIDKRLRVLGPRTFIDGPHGRRVSVPGECVKVPVRWEYAYGGTSVVMHAANTSGKGNELLLNEVCFTNPLGCGWLEERYLKLVMDKDVLATPDVLSVPGDGSRVAQFRAPQIEAWDQPTTLLDVVKHAESRLDAQQMAVVATSYQMMPAGLGVIGRAWTPRLQRAGTYDEAWLETRWPHLPADFDFGYWNGAPDDQQIPWPKPGAAFELANLARSEDTRSGLLKIRLPQHRAIVAQHYLGGRVEPVEMQLDTIFFDTDEMKVSLTWRATFPPQPDVRICEARFETDPSAPLLRLTQKVD
ncbi:DUF2169 family type VI secretion system accessory protein [Burkholderia pseudomallei]|uniref:DUF2169 family type VI secretion system accessory protein n=1 Tax=Burkholderia pseudomallei TaxID=28450 RepID=UPI0009CD2DAA|nr:DUF2169 domain-containing protein [Burkholderia pseudomallei]OMW45527.1 hypothetical protein AQ810_17140 [Burkholderia pseudomallei]